MDQKLGQCKCLICDKFLSSTHALKRHQIEVHKNKELTIKKHIFRIICPECDSVFSRYNLLRKHFLSEHNFRVEELNLEFNTMEEFEIWRSDMQNSTSSEYVKVTSTKKLIGGWKRTVLVCNRSYKSRCDFSGTRKRALKIQGTKKTGKFCPSAIEVFQNNKVYVKFWKTHYGHNFDLGHLRLDKTHKEEIAELLKEGMSFQHIIDAIRNTKHHSKRVNLLDKKDLHNIIRDYNISYKMIDCQDNEKMSILRLKRKAQKCLSVIEGARASIINCQEIERHLDKAIALARSTPRLISKRKIIINSEIEKQKSIFIKKRRKNKKYTQTSNTDKIINDNLTAQEENVYVCTNHDHTYHK